MCSFQGALKIFAFELFFRFVLRSDFQNETLVSVILSKSFFNQTIRPGSYVKASLPQHALPRKEVIQPHLPIRLPCYDFTPVICLTFGSCPLAVSSLTSGAPNSHGVTGGVYKARERIHRDMLIRDY